MGALGPFLVLVVVIAAKILQRFQVRLASILPDKIIHRLNIRVRQLKLAVKVLEDPLLAYAFGNDGDVTAEEVAEYDLGRGTSLSCRISCRYLCDLRVM